MPQLTRLWRGHKGRRLVEPFCGGLAVALGLRPSRALLNDINPHLINFYRHLRAGLVTDLPMANLRTTYYAHRRRFNELLAGGDIDTAEDWQRYKNKLSARSALAHAAQTASP